MSAAESTPSVSSADSSQLVPASRGLLPRLGPGGQDMAEDLAYLSGHNAAFHDILRRVDPDKYDADAPWGKAVTDAIDEKLSDVHVKKLKRRGVPDWMLPTTLTEGEKAKLKDCFLWMRNFKSRTLLARRSLFEYARSHNGVKHMDDSHFFTLLRMNNMLPPDPGTRAAIVKRYTDKDPKLTGNERLDFMRFFKEALPDEWRAEAEALNEAPSAAVMQAKGDNTWRTTELVRRIGARRAEQLVDAAHNTIAMKKTAERQVRLQRHHHGQELLNIVGAELRERDILGQAEQQWNMDFNMKMMTHTTRTGMRNVSDRTTRLDDMARRIQGMYRMGMGDKCDKSDLKGLRNLNAPCDFSDKNNPNRCTAHGGKRVESKEIQRTVGDEIDEELENMHKGTHFDDRYITCWKCRKPIMPRLLDEHLRSCDGPFKMTREHKEMEAKDEVELEGKEMVHYLQTEKHKEREAAKVKLKRCELCGRRVQPDRFEKHVEACELRRQLKEEMLERDKEFARRQAQAAAEGGGLMVPRPPQHFRLAQDADGRVLEDALTPISIKFEWEPPIIDGGSPIYDYEINYQIRTTTLRGKEKLHSYEDQPPYQTSFYCMRVPPTHFGCTMQNCRSSVTYANVTVRCRNLVGWSKPSSVIATIAMPRVAPPSPPLLLTLHPALPSRRAEAVSSSAISVIWSAPMSDGGARLDHYLLQYIVSEEVMTERGYGRGGGLEANYRDVEKTIKVPFDRDATAQMHTIANLIGATDYKRIQVTAVNVCGSKHLVGEPSAPIECVRTDEPTMLQLLQNELARARRHKLDLIDAHIRINGLSQRIVLDEYVRMIIEQLDAELLRLGRDRPRTGAVGAKQRRRAMAMLKEQRELQEHEQKANKAREALEAELEGELLTENELQERRDALESTLADAKLEITARHDEEKQQLAAQERQAEEMGIGGQMVEGSAEQEASMQLQREEEEKKAKEKEKAKTVDDELFPHYEARLEQFNYRMQKIAEDIQLAEQERMDTMARQAELVYTMTITTKRIAQLAAELDRVARFRGSNIDSAVIHGQSQRFDKVSLREQLRKEVQKEQASIGQCKKEIIVGRKQRDAAMARKDKRLDEMQERRAALQSFKNDAKRRKLQAGAVRAAGNRSLVHTFGLWTGFVQRRKHARQLMTRLGMRLQCAEIAHGIRCWKMLVGRKRASQKADDGLVSVGDKMLRRVGEQRSEVVEQYDAAMTSVAGVKGLLKLSSVGHANLVRMQRAGRYEETEWAAIARGDAPGTQANMGLVNLGDGLFRQREMHEAEHYYVRHVQKMQHIGDLRALATGYSRIGRVCEALQLPSKGIVNYDRSRDIAKEANDECQIGAACCGLGRCYHALAAYRQAIIMFNRGLGHFLTMGDRMGEADCYRGLRDAYDLLHEKAHVRRFETKLRRIVQDRQDRADAAMKRLDALRTRLVGATAEQAACVTLERVLPLVMRLRAKKDHIVHGIEQQSEVHKRLLRENKTLFTNVKLIEEELANVVATDAEEVDTRIVHGDARTKGMVGAAQRWKTKELRKVLREKLAGVADEVDSAKKHVEHVKFQIKNWKDEVKELDEELAVETGPLMKRVIAKQPFRFIALNPSNPAGQDVMGFSTGGVPKVVAVHDTTVFVYDIMEGTALLTMLGDKEGRHLGELRGHSKIITALCFFEERVYTGSADCTIRVWNIGASIEGKDHDYDDYDSHSDGGYGSDAGAAYSDYGGSKKGGSGSGSDGWGSYSDEEEAAEPEEGRALTHMVLQGHEGTVTALAVDIFKIVSGSADTTVRFWHKETGECLKIVRGHSGSITSLDLDPEVLMTGGADGEVMMWDILGIAESLFSLKVGSRVEALYDEDDWFPGKITAIDGEPGETQYYDVLYDDGDEEFALPMRRLRLPERDESENPFKKITRKHRLRGHFEVNEAGIRVKAYTVTVVRYAVSEIVSADTHGQVIVWETKTGAELLRVRHHTDAVLDLCFDAVKIVTASRDHTLRVTDIASGENTMTLRGHTGAVLSVQFDSAKALSASEDGTLRQWTWDTGTGDEKKQRMHTLDWPHENLAKIARKYEVKVADLLEWNGIQDTSELYPGIQLIVQKDQSSKLESAAEKRKREEKDAAKKQQLEDAEATREAEEQAALDLERQKADQQE